MNSIFKEIQKDMDEFFDHIDSILDRDPDEVDVITDHLPEPEKCCTICEFSEPGDGCGANDLSELEQLEMEAELSVGV